MVGAMVCTTLSDKFGRKPVFLFSQWAMVVVGAANAFAPNFYVFTVFRFFVGVFQQVCQSLLLNVDEDLTLKANAKDLAFKVKARTRTTILSLRTTNNQGQHLWILA